MNWFLQHLITFFEKKGLNIKRKIITVLTIVSIIPMIFISIYSVYITNILLEKKVTSQYTRMLEIEKENFRTEVLSFIKNVFLISELPSLKNFISANNELNHQLLLEDFITVARSHPEFLQIRLLNLDGMELVRVNRGNQKITVVAETDLQFKGDRKYFQKAITTEPEQFYISPIELNQEFGEIEEPHTPVLRISRVIFNDYDEEVGVIIVNVLMDGLLNKLKSYENEKVEFFAVKYDGSYISHPNETKLWGGKYDLNTGISLFNEYPIVNQLLGKPSEEIYYSKSLLKPNIIFTKLDNNSSNDDFILFGVTLSPFFQMSSIIPYAMLYLVMFITGLYVSRKIGVSMAERITNPIYELKKGIVKISNEDLTHRIHIDTNDEISDLAKRFNRMGELLEKVYTELELKVIERTTELVLLNEELKTANKQKELFLANMSHELKTPINAMVGFLEDLVDGEFGDLTAEQKSVIEKILREEDLLINTINDILLWSKIEKGEMKLNRSSFHFGQFIKENLLLVEKMANRKKIHIKTIVDCGKVCADETKLGQVFTNLMTNAIKFSPELGEIIVIGRVNKKEFSLSVIDSGIGISKKELSNIFEEFYQVESPLTKTYQGSGLGLSITKTLVHLHHGTIEVKSELGKGSTFTVIIPLEEEGEEDDNYSFGRRS